MALSPQHEALVELFRHRPALAVDLRAKGHGLHLPGTVAPLPADATQLQPAERRADLVMRLEAPAGGSVGVVSVGVVDVQLQPDEAKRRSWPVYLSGLRERHRHGVVLLVLRLHRATARWARRRSGSAGRRSPRSPTWTTSGRGSVLISSCSPPARPSAASWRP